MVQARRYLSELHATRFAENVRDETNGLGVAPQVVEKLLNHVLEGVLAVYNLHEYPAERVQALELWTKALDTIIFDEGAKSVLMTGT